MSLQLHRRGVVSKAFTKSVRDYFTRLGDLRVTAYDKANARLIDRLVEAGGNFWPDSGAFCAMAGYLFPSGGTLIPLKAGHTAGTLVDFVSGDLNAVTGLKGNGSSKYVDTLINPASYGTSNTAFGFHVTEGATVGILMGNGGAEAGTNTVGRTSTRHSNGSVDLDWDAELTGTRLLSRESSAGYFRMSQSVIESVTREAQDPRDRTMRVFATSTGAAVGSTFFSDMRSNIYVFIPALSQADAILLDTILTDWQTDLANA